MNMKWIRAALAAAALCLALVGLPATAQAATSCTAHSATNLAGYYPPSACAFVWTCTPRNGPFCGFAVRVEVHAWFTQNQGGSLKGQTNYVGLYGIGYYGLSGIRSDSASCVASGGPGTSYGNCSATTSPLDYAGKGGRMVVTCRAPGLPLPVKYVLSTVKCTVLY